MSCRFVSETFFGREFDSPHLHSTRFALAKLARGKPPTRENKRRPDGRLLFEVSVPSIVDGLYYAFMYFIYMIRNTANKLYIGVTKNPQARLRYHNEKRGAQYTKRIPTFKIVFLEQYATLANARKREVQIKKWRREKKDNLISKYQRGFQTMK